MGLAVSLSVPGAAQESPAPSAHPGDGVPDPAGRINFGRIVAQDDICGQIVALYAFHTAIYRMDADGSNPELLGDPDAFDIDPPSRRRARGSPSSV